jgi:hypothetical protein
MRFWPRRPRVDDAVPREPRPYENLNDAEHLTHLIDEGYLVVASALLLSTKNGIILSTLRDGESWNEDAAIALARSAADALLEELTATEEHLSRQARRVAPELFAVGSGSGDATSASTEPAPGAGADPPLAAPRPRHPSRAERAQQARDRKRRRRLHEEGQRLLARTRTMRGVIDRVRATRDDDETLRAIALRARDETLSEMVHARLIPRATSRVVTDEEHREAMAGVRADLARLIEAHEGY